MRSIVAALTLTVSMSSGCLAEAPDLYERVDKKLADDPKLAEALGKPALQMRDIEWMAGTWDVLSEGPGSPKKGVSVVSPVFGGVWLEMRDTYPEGNQDIGYTGYDPALGKWVNIGIDAVGNANRFYAEGGWTSGRLVFTCDCTVIGVPAKLRQTFTKVSDTEYNLVNEELVGGKWVFLDRYSYKKHPAK